MGFILAANFPPNCGGECMTLPDGGKVGPARFTYNVSIPLRGSNPLIFNNVVPSQPRGNVNVEAARAGDPCRVFVFGDRIYIQVVEAPYFYDCEQ